MCTFPNDTTVGCCRRVFNVHFTIFFVIKGQGMLITSMCFVEPDPERAVAAKKYVHTDFNEFLFCWILNTGQNATLKEEKQIFKFKFTFLSLSWLIWFLTMPHTASSSIGPFNFICDKQVTITPEGQPRITLVVFLFCVFGTNSWKDTRLCRGHLCDRWTKIRATKELRTIVSFWHTTHRPILPIVHSGHDENGTHTVSCKCLIHFVGKLTFSKDT